MRFLPILMLLAGCGEATPNGPAGADLAAPGSAGDDLAVTPGADLALRDGGDVPGLDGGACLATTPTTTLYLDYCMDAASSFCFHDVPNDGFF
jgi:hypothetical protein